MTHLPLYLGKQIIKQINKLKHNNINSKCYEENKGLEGVLGRGDTQ